MGQSLIIFFLLGLQAEQESMPYMAASAQP